MKKKRSLKAIKRDLDSAVSRFIRQRDCDETGFGLCISCDAMIHWKVANAGHFIARQHMATRFHEFNCHLQCVMCNLYKHGNLINYTLAMQQRYGQSVVDELMRLKRTTVKMGRAEYTALLEKYSLSQ